MQLCVSSRSQPLIFSFEGRRSFNICIRPYVPLPLSLHPAILSKPPVSPPPLHNNEPPPLIGRSGGRFIKKLFAGTPSSQSAYTSQRTNAGSVFKSVSVFCCQKLARRCIAQAECTSDSFSTFTCNQYCDYLSAL